MGIQPPVFHRYQYPVPVFRSDIHTRSLIPGFRGIPLPASRQSRPIPGFRNYGHADPNGYSPHDLQGIHPRGRAMPYPIDKWALQDLDEIIEMNR